jgi:hypothetical protein
MYKLLIIADAMGLAVMAVLTGKLDLDPAKNHATATSNQFGLMVRFPLLSPTQAIVQGAPLDEIAFAFTPGIDLPDLPPDKARTTIGSFGNHVLDAVTPVFVDFFERHRPWARTKCGGDAYAWPTILNFARVVRNAISHHDGHVHFENPNADPVQWRHLVYSPADNGKQIVGTDIQLGELIILMFEISAELDRLGCPLNP